MSQTMMGLEVVVGIETDRGPWVLALVAAGYTVLAVNPLQAARYRERLAVSGAKSDAADAHMLADMVRTDSRQLRPVAGDSAQAEAVKVVARMHKTLIWERTRHTQRLRHALREYFPAALVAFEDLDAPDTLELLARRLIRRRRRSWPLLRSARCSSGRVGVTSLPRPEWIQAALRTERLGQPAVVTAAYAASTRALVAVLAAVDQQVKAMHKEVEAHFGQHPDAEIIASAGLGGVLGAGCSQNPATTPPVCSAKARSNYAGTSHHPGLRQEEDRAGPHVHNDRLINAS